MSRRSVLTQAAFSTAGLVRSLPAGTPVASVCGGHESSNAATVAGDGAVILDLARLKSIEFHRSGDRSLVTTLEMADESVVRGAEQRVISFETREQAVAFAREALRIPGTGSAITPTRIFFEPRPGVGRPPGC